MEEGGQQRRRHRDRRDVVSGRRDSSRGLHLGEERRPHGLRQPQVTGVVIILFTAPLSPPLTLFLLPARLCVAVNPHHQIR